MQVFDKWNEIVYEMIIEMLCWIRYLIHDFIYRWCLYEIWYDSENDIWYVIFRIRQVSKNWNDKFLINRIDCLNELGLIRDRLKRILDKLAWGMWWKVWYVYDKQITVILQI